MLCRHIDVIAVFAIALGLLGVSHFNAHWPAFGFPADMIRVENIAYLFSR